MAAARSGFAKLAAFAEGLFSEDRVRKSEEKGGKIAPNALGAVVGDGEGRVGKNAECVSVGECRRGKEPARVAPRVGVRGEMSEVRFTSGTMTDSPEAPFRWPEEEAEAWLEGWFADEPAEPPTDEDEELLPSCGPLLAKAVLAMPLRPEAKLDICEAAID